MLTGVAENAGRGQAGAAQLPRELRTPQQRIPLQSLAPDWGSKASLGSWATPQGTFLGPRGLCRVSWALHGAEPTQARLLNHGERRLREQPSRSTGKRQSPGWDEVTNKWHYRGVP